MQIRFNGKPITLSQATSLLDFLKSQGIDPKTGSIAAAVNETVARRAEWPALALKDGDRVELIQAVQGG